MEKLTYEQVKRASEGDCEALETVLEPELRKKAVRPVQTFSGRVVWQEDPELKGRMISRLLREIPRFDCSRVKRKET
ncbi:MAG: helix-turn-helix domain-containing protein [Oscillospiraceae bacterium]|nr:helix-turn-helix domain-containing protein [Oscillospiraceae bacterium]